MADADAEAKIGGGSEVAGEAEAGGGSHAEAEAGSARIAVFTKATYSTSEENSAGGVSDMLRTSKRELLAGVESSSAPGDNEGMLFCFFFFQCLVICQLLSSCDISIGPHTSAIVNLPMKA